MSMARVWFYELKSEVGWEVLTEVADASAEANQSRVGMEYNQLEDFIVA